MYTVWLTDLPEVLRALHEKLPHMVTFSKIEGNAYGDYIITYNEDYKYLVKHEDFSVWKMNGNWKKGGWTRI